MISYKCRLVPDLTSMLKEPSYVIIIFPIALLNTYGIPNETEERGAKKFNNMVKMEDTCRKALWQGGFEWILNRYF